MTLTTTDYIRVTELIGEIPARVSAETDGHALKWVLSTADAALEAFTYAAENNEYLDDVAHEVADAAVPVFTYSVWTVYYQLGAWNRQLTDYEDALTQDPTHNARVTLYDIALEIANKVLADFEKEREYANA
jgi:hypothetical protein